MESCVKLLGVQKQLDPCNCLYSRWISIPKEQLLDKLLLFVKVVVEYTFGMQIGYVIGWVIGFYAGHSYVEHFEPVYLDDLSQLSGLLSYWGSMPEVFARHGALIGVAIGVIAIAVINNKLLSQRVTSLYKEGITSSNDIARLLGENVVQIERKMHGLVKEG